MVKKVPTSELKKVGEGDDEESLSPRMASTEMSFNQQSGCSSRIPIDKRTTYQKGKKTERKR